MIIMILGMALPEFPFYIHGVLGELCNLVAYSFLEGTSNNPSYALLFTYSYQPLLLYVHSLGSPLTNSTSLRPHLEPCRWSYLPCYHTLY